MLDEQTYEKLVALKLNAMAAAWREYLENSDKDALSFAERFGLIVDREWSDRQQRRLSRRLQMAKLRETACLEDIDYHHPRNLDRSVIQRLAALRWIAQHENLLITGPTGIGKTWIACAFAQKACRDGLSAFYIRLPRLFQAFQLARGDGSYLKELSRLARIDLLVLDDWGLLPLQDIDRRELLEILEDRHGRRSTIVTSQLPVDKWHAYIGEPTVADSILDRLLHNAHRIALSGHSKRKTRTEKKDKS
jgi:DNA replication protein DnaC